MMAHPEKGFPLTFLGVECQSIGELQRVLELHRDAVDGMPPPGFELTGISPGMFELVRYLRAAPAQAAIAGDPQAVQLAQRLANEVEQALAHYAQTAGQVMEQREAVAEVGAHRKRSSKGGHAPKLTQEQIDEGGRLWHRWQRSINLYASLEEFYAALAAVKITRRRETALKLALRYAAVETTKPWRKRFGERLTAKGWLAVKATWKD
ncbi:hypothetical protein [Paraburkholderia saeva]|uniref:Uncharacterized protein n=1 Tax=Paraburkholderia saeva TaxID=2777537 RepID=A0A9N8RX45_9BURK|nr:hypothetical protein [Paraburkholderia saeva]CAG4900948.1 hypothetical protein LMG31841_02936 [Paraburkholderia saeva]